MKIYPISSYLADYMFNVLRHQCQPNLRMITLLSQHTPSSKIYVRAVRYLFLCGRDQEFFIRILRLHAQISVDVCFNEDIQLILGHALGDVLKKQGVQSKVTSAEEIKQQSLSDVPCRLATLHMVHLKVVVGLISLQEYNHGKELHWV
jgi:hypothetical protein